MPNRASETDVLAIMDTSLTEEQITPFLDAANSVVDEKCTGLEYSDKTLRQIETWLAAHFACARDPQIAESKAGEAAWKFEGKTDLGLDSTRYGQRVKILDSKGSLADLDSAKTPAELKHINPS